MLIPKTCEELNYDNSYGHQHDEDDQDSDHSIIKPSKQLLGLPMKLPSTNKSSLIIPSVPAKQGDFGALAISSLPELKREDSSLLNDQDEPQLLNDAKEVSDQALTIKKMVPIGDMKSEGVSMDGNKDPVQDITMTDNDEDGSNIICTISNKRKREQFIKVTSLC